MKKSKKHKKTGFTLIEALTVVLVITILVMIAVPNFIGLKERAKEENVIVNMGTLRVMLETYRVDWKEYPKNLLELGNEATTKNYNKRIRNPFSNKVGAIEMPASWAIDYLGEIGQAGFVGYQYIDSLKYYLFGYNGDGKLIKKSGKVYIISNG